MNDAKAHRKRGLRIGVFMLLALGAAVFALWPRGEVEAAPPIERIIASQAPEPDARQVVIGVYINQLKSVSMLDNEFVIDFWLWFRFKGEDYKPLDNIEIIGGVEESRTNEQVKPLPDGETYTAARIIARIKKFFDVTRFPIDNHTLRIEIEDGQSEIHLVKFVPDTANSQLDPVVVAPGWEIVSSRAVETTRSYTTNYGDTSLPTGKESKYS